VTYVDQMKLVVVALGQLPAEQPPAKLDRAIAAALEA
jgi:hypothetical protein